MADSFLRIEFAHLLEASRSGRPGGAAAAGFGIAARLVELDDGDRVPDGHVDDRRIRIGRPAFEEILGPAGERLVDPAVGLRPGGFHLLGEDRIAAGAAVDRLLGEAGLPGRPGDVVAGREGVEEVLLRLLGPAVAPAPDQLGAVLAMASEDGARRAGGPFGTPLFLFPFHLRV